ncbi:hypothetical protein M2447_000665 [Ereboglobus sp. PH5-10]|uniref:ATP-binding protein n=1 Tax=Ereboglobus sp. PH5-10 TaxID=2940629 RepID=UPI0024057302|nr:ATP-binding protein [Ereboglobus sp. PH5-10]MDF9826584.1 hypothetical protein [Ereboglobus sp. PH5-10]
MSANKPANSNNTSPIKRRERDAILQSLQAGLVPRQGLHHIQVGRKREVEALLTDIERIVAGSAAFRIVVGRFGSGKSFFLNLVRTLALQKNLVVVQADMTMERRLYATTGEARALYTELLRNLATRSKPEGGGLPGLVENWISRISHKVKSAGGDDAQVKARLNTDLADIQQLVGGYEFAEVLSKYYEGHQNGDDSLKTSALRWLRGEFATKTDARHALGVRRIISDETIYDSLKLMAAFCVKAGYAGMVVNIDELVVLSHRLPSKRARQANYEMVLTLINDCLQGTVAHLGFIFAGTDECIEDTRRGLYSYEALRTRLQGNSFAQGGLIDFSGPVIRLACLSPEELYVLLANIRNVHASGDPARHLVPDAALLAVLRRANDTLGADYFKTPRDVIRSFVGLLNVLEQNPGTKWEDLVSGDGFLRKATTPLSIEEELEANPIALPDADENDDLATLKL